jgi:type IV secretory pathway VirB10-like protein
MLPTTPNGAPANDPTIEPQLTDRTPAPKGVLQKNIKMYVYFGGILVLVLAMFFSSGKKKTGPSGKPKDATPAPEIQDNTASNVAALRTQLDMEKQRQQQEAALAAASANYGTPAQQTAAASLGANGQPVPVAQSNSGQAAQPTPEQQQVQQLAAKERERQYASRFASNLVYSHTQQERQAQLQQGSGQTQQNPYAAAAQPGQGTNLTAPRAAGEQATATYKRAAEVNVDAAVGQPYVIYEGLTLDTVLMNRLDGDAAGPVKVLVSNPVYSHDRQHVLVPEGTIVLGEARKIGSSGFGQQRRLAVVFHRMIMPDGYSVDLDQFHGLDQVGEEGLKDKVNNHYLQIFGTSIALGVVSGAAQITQGGTGYNSTGSEAFVNGAAAGISQQATTIMDRFIQIPPTITIREGHRVKVYFTQDLLLPAYTNHIIPQSF